MSRTTLNKAGAVFFLISVSNAFTIFAMKFGWYVVAGFFISIFAVAVWSMIFAAICIIFDLGI